MKVIDKIIDQLGSNIAKLHNSDMIHGDLTTSNMLLKLKYSLNNYIGIVNIKVMNLN